MQSCLIARKEIGEADILIEPLVSPAGLNDAQGRERARKAGFDATKAISNRWESLISERRAN
jgi:NTE family protein